MREGKCIYLRILRDTVRPIKHFFLSFLRYLGIFIMLQVLELEKTIASRLVVRGGDLGEKREFNF
jgi:hypothetical protein